VTSKWLWEDCVQVWAAEVGMLRENKNKMFINLKSALGGSISQHKMVSRIEGRLREIVKKDSCVWKVSSLLMGCV